jgi:hypothetical protein
MGYLPESGRDFRNRREFTRVWLRAFVRTRKLSALRIAVEGPKRAMNRLGGCDLEGQS